MNEQHECRAGGIAHDCWCSVGADHRDDVCRATLEDAYSPESADSGEAS